MISNNICPVCGGEHSKLSKHFSAKHPEELKEEEARIVDMWRSGLSNRAIAATEGIIYAGASGIKRVVERHTTAEEREALRVSKLKRTLKEDYASGKYDWVKDINTERNKSEEGRAKNSEGLKRAYEDGSKVSWNAGLNRYIDDRVASYGDKVSATMQERYSAGGHLYKPGSHNYRWREDRRDTSKYVRIFEGFTRSDRKKLLRKFDYKCAKCGISEGLLKEERKLLDKNRWGLECDHIKPIVVGGERDIDVNGQVLCTKCHSIKSLSEFYLYDEHHRLEGNELEDKLLEVENKYNSVPIQILRALFDGEVLGATSIKVSDLNVYVAPLTYTECLDRHRLSGLFVDKKRLIIYADEWVHKRDLVLSMIRAKTMGSEGRVYARKCKVVELDTSAQVEFFNSNHLSGYSAGIFSYGLEYCGEVIAGISFRKPFNKAHLGKIEISRFAIRAGFSVPGGFSKLLKNSLDRIRSLDYNTIMTYADLRFSSGNVYSVNGFKFIGKTKLDYGYTDGNYRYNRLRFRAKDGKSEKEVAAEAGVYKFYGCGNNLYEIEI